jgi:hypothetical protein
MLAGFCNAPTRSTVSADFMALRAEAPRIKRFVHRHGARAAHILANAFAASFSGSPRMYAFIESTPPRDEPQEACAIVRSVGWEAAALIPLLIREYYCSHSIDFVA